MNLEVFILGTGGMMPLPGRSLTSVLVRREGDAGASPSRSSRRMKRQIKELRGASAVRRSRSTPRCGEPMVISRPTLPR